MSGRIAIFKRPTFAKIAGLDAHPPAILSAILESAHLTIVVLTKVEMQPLSTWKNGATFASTRPQLNNLRMGILTACNHAVEASFLLMVSLHLTVFVFSYQCVIGENSILESIKNEIAPREKNFEPAHLFRKIPKSVLKTAGGRQSR